jgi:TusE/DsrC/DsvC family sulfur relay protein
MQDITKLVQAEDMAPCEAEAFLQGLDLWTEDMARETARREGLDLTDEHMDVLCYLRDHYMDCGPARNARILLKSLEDAYLDQGGRKYLYRLFPGGPVTQGSRLAGLPTPPGSVDRSFGTAH